LLEIDAGDIDRERNPDRMSRTTPQQADADIHL